MSDSLILLEKCDAVARITINRPLRRNAVTNELMRSLIRTCEAVADDTSIHIVVISASGSDFSVGADLEQFKDAADGERPSLLQQRRDAELGGRLLRAIRELPQPSICAIQGVAVGAGACIAIACDFRVATQSARFGFSEVRLGMNLMWGALPLVVSLIGPARAKRLLILGEVLDAPTLYEWGFLDRLCEEAELTSVVQAWVAELAAVPPVAAQMIKRSVDRYALALAESISHMDADQWLLTTRSDDFQEAIEAFLSKRKPTFVGN